MSDITQKILDQHFELIEKDGEKIVKFKVSKDPENVTTNKKRKRKSTGGNAK